MKSTFPAKKYFPTSAALLVFICLAIYLFSYSHPARSFSENQLIRDLIWLDAWSLFFFLLVAIIWIAKLRWRTKALLYISCFSIYGFITICLIFNGTPFSLNSYWGDQQFRQAMILKFCSFVWPGDFYYKDLPPFYPPVYYFLLSLYARLFSVEAYKTLKIGSMFIYLLGPALLFYFWRRLVTDYQAFFVTLATYLFCSFGIVYPLSVPHAFLADSFFIPWWLYYIEQVKKPVSNWKYYLFGGLIGAALFCTYFYSFFIGGVLLLLRTTVFARWEFIRKASHFDLKKAMGVLLSAALFSAPYWLPPFISIFTYGIDRTRGGWHHIGSTGLTFKYLEFSLPGLLFLGAIVYALRRFSAPLYKGLLLLAGTSILYWLIGSMLGVFDRPINLVKSRQFIVVLAGPFVGLAIAGIIRKSLLSKKNRYVTATIASLILLIFLHHFNGTAKNDFVKRARTSVVPTWNTDAEQMKQRKGTVFLTGNPDFPSFYPVYCFTTTNEHYAHPASRYKQRYDYLYLLQEIDNPYLFHLALWYNIYDRVDYFMPRKKNNSFEVHVNLSNYPNRSYLKTLKYSQDVVEDNSLFKKETGDHLYAVLQQPSPSSREKYAYTTTSFMDSLLFLARLHWIRQSLDLSGKELLDQYVAVDWTGWHNLRLSEGKADFGRTISLTAAYAVERADTIYFIFGFQAEEDITIDYKIFLHLYPTDATGAFDNFDFVPDQRTGAWKKGDIVLCYHSVPKRYEGMRVHLGFFRGQTRLGKGFWSYLPLRNHDKDLL